MFRLAVLLIVVFFLQGCKGLVGSPCPDCKQSSEEFILSISRGEIRPAFSALLKEGDHNQYQIDALTTRTGAQLKKHGRVIGHEYYNSKVISEKMVAVSYLLYQEDAVTRWAFYFYKPDQDWGLLNVDATDIFGDFDDI